MKAKRAKTQPAAATQLRSGQGHPFASLRSYMPLGGGEYRLYQSLREALPVLDAAIEKLVRLSGSMSVVCENPAAQKGLTEFLRTVPCGRGQRGIDSFLSAYLGSLLTYGRAVGEMIVSQGRLAAVCWGDVAQLQVEEGDSPLEFALCAYDENGTLRRLPYQHLLLFTTLNPEPANPYGVSLLRSMPFLADILLKIYNTIGVNWERAGNVRYAVVCKPDAADRGSASERAEAIAQEWSEAMQDAKNGVVRDFVAVGDVSVKVIGADGQILDSEVPVRQIMEQLVAKTGLPPFLLGLSWSTTERMSKQQADMLTSELWSIRRTVEPALYRICELWLRLNGFGGGAEIVWEDISLQDLVEEAQAQLYRAQAQKLNSEKG